MERICVYTCITGNYDNLNEIKNPEKNIDYYCFTNNKKIKSKTWKIIHIEDKSLNDVCLARKIKILGHPIINNHYDIAIWTDADIIWQKSISDFTKTYLKSKSFAIFKHHARTNIHDEAITCLRLRKDSKEHIVNILNFYQSINFPDNAGLCESTVFIKKINDAKVSDTMNIWFNMVKKYSHRDQLSFNYAVWKTKLKVSYINLNVWDNAWFHTVKHNPLNPAIKECHVYYGNPDQEFDINKYHIYSYHQHEKTYSINVTIPNDTKEIEFNPTNFIGIKHQSISIKPNPDKIIVHGDALSISCNDHYVIRIYGNFHKNQKLFFTITMDISSPTEINKLIEYQWTKNNQLSNKNQQLEQVVKRITAQNKQLLLNNQELQKNIWNITNSKGWRLLEKVRKVIHH